MTKSISMLVLLLGITAPVLAQSPNTKTPTINKETNAELPLSYRVWKEQQILDAQNSLLRAQSSLRQNMDSDTRGRIEKEVRRASDQVDAAKEFNVEEYLAIYLSKFQDRSDLVLQMIDKLSKEEAKEILTGTFRKAFQPNNAKQKQTNLVVGSRQQ